MGIASHANDVESIKSFRDRAFGFTPDEKELWISDQAANALYVFDNTVFPPKQSAKIDISKGGSKFVEVQFDKDGAATRTGDQFGVGRVTATDLGK